MAEGLQRHLGGGAMEVFSAGAVATEVRLEAISVMVEMGIDSSHQTSKTLGLYLQQHLEYVITVCDRANDECPFFPHAERRLHWSIDDPSSVVGSVSARLAVFRIARDALLEKIRTELLPLLIELGL
jgi:arsenate reductase